MMMLPPLRNEIFAGNRAVGQVAFTVAAAPDRSRRSRVYEAGSLRVRFPNAPSQTALDAVIVNTAGGMTGGDRFDIAIKVGAGAQLTVTTAAAEKIYRSLGPDTEIAINLDVAPGGTLKWLPQESIVFDQVRLRRTIDVGLARDANLLLSEAYIFGRSAMGEVVVDGSILDRWRVRVGDTLVLADALRLDDKIGQRLAQRAVAGASVAVATVVKIPGDDGDAAAVRVLQNQFAGEVGISAWNGLVMARLVALGGAALRRDLIAILTALGGAPLPGLWLN